MSDAPAADEQRAAVARLCAAVRQAIDRLALDPSSVADLERQLTVAEARVAASADGSTLVDSVKSIRYVLVESADGPIAAVLADSAARIVGDGIGRLFM